ncbi:RNA polymerase sigma factor RpoE [Agarivorans sp. Toyoura001]|uniref:sigma-70 family RNA polymerase sigma factor n=1 Tax=Agarivorans sp. Toyoura001 TaxID=2283141 RepID=UPI0010DAA834|nr:sigma-70 family RNA polymerase sigma factor [Agarivorans sp. Toyoura001]GDY24904.1 RNA polymerase sigma factor RpoE [Agarivorans sp. Toyoura001]
MKCLMKAWSEAEPLLYGWLIKQTNNQHEAEDIMQEVFLKAMSNSERFCKLDDGKAWLFKITKNHFIDKLRQKLHATDISDLSASDSVAPVMTQLQQCLPKVLPKLSDSDRDIIEQCALNGLTQLEYAKQQQLSLPATKARLRRARMQLEFVLTTECKVKRDEAGVCCFKNLNDGAGE